MISRPFYRTRQFFGALRPNVRNAERREVTALLGSRLTPLFESMSPRDQRHCLDTYGRLRATGCEDAELLRAALLHDSGKGRLSGSNVHLWHRVAYVLLEDLAPGLLQRMAARRGVVSVLHHHAERGALLAEALGASADVAALIRSHQDHDTQDGRLLMLRDADGDS